MSIFDNITFMNEASNPADYKKEKQQRAEAKNKAEQETNNRRSANHTGDRFRKNPNVKRGLRSDDDAEFDKADEARISDNIRSDWAHHKANKLGVKNPRVAEKINKDFRRHPDRYREYIKSNYTHPGSEEHRDRALRHAGFKTEAGIFESVEII